MTPRESQTLAFIRDYQAGSGGRSPSLTDIAAYLGLASRSNAHSIVASLIRQGHLRRVDGSHRALVVLDAEVPRLLADYSTAELIAELDKRLPYGSAQFAFDPIHARNNAQISAVTQ